MKYLKYIAILLIVSSYELAASWGTAKFQVRVYNKTDQDIKVITGGREGSKGDPYFIGNYDAQSDKSSRKDLKKAYEASGVIAAGATRLIENTHQPRTIFVWYKPTAGYYEAEIGLFAVANKVELYVYKGTDNKPYVAVWNMNLLQPVFPNGLTKNDDGSVQNIDKITPGSTSPTAWNGDVSKQMLTMYDKNTKPDTNG